MFPILVRSKILQALLAVFFSCSAGANSDALGPEQPWETRLCSASFSVKDGSKLYFLFDIERQNGLPRLGQVSRSFHSYLDHALSLIESGYPRNPEPGLDKRSLRDALERLREAGTAAIRDGHFDLQSVHQLFFLVNQLLMGFYEDVAVDALNLANGTRKRAVDLTLEDMKWWILRASNLNQVYYMVRITKALEKGWLPLPFWESLSMRRILDEMAGGKLPVGYNRGPEYADAVFLYSAEFAAHDGNHLLFFPLYNPVFKDNWSRVASRLDSYSSERDRQIDTGILFFLFHERSAPMRKAPTGKTERSLVSELRLLQDSSQASLFDALLGRMNNPNDFNITGVSVEALKAGISRVEKLIEIMD